jgi:diguanylate cyclase
MLPLFARGTIAAGLAATAWAAVVAVDEGLAPQQPWLAGILAAAFLVAEARPVSWLRRREVQVVTVSMAYGAALIFLLPGYGAAVAIGAGSLLGDALRRVPPLKCAFNAAMLVVATTAATAILRAADAQDLLAGPVAGRDVAAIVLAFGASYTINAVLVNTVIALASEQLVWPSIRRDFFLSLPTDGILLALAPVLVLIGTEHPVLLPAAMLLTLAVYRSSRDAAASAEDAMRDPLTGLPNRRVLDERAEQALERAVRLGMHPTVLLIDLDAFKAINDVHGHAAGDAVIVAVADALLAAAPADALVARLGGDEFAVLLPSTGSAAEGEAAGAGIAEVFPIAVELPGDAPATICVDASVGCSTLLTSADAVGDLLRAADEAMYRAKRTGSRFAPSPLLGASRDLLSELDRAMRDGSDELSLVYQPVVDVRTRAVVSFEALIRWDHPGLGPIGPDVFIPLVESSSMIDGFTDLVIDRGAAFLATASAAGHRVDLAVNVSARNLGDRGFVERLAGHLARHGVEPGRLTVEITETALVDDIGRVREALDRLHALGVPVVLDDFGAGHSSLAKLRDLPVTGIKIDRGFIATPEDLLADQVLATLVQLGHAMGLEVTAEGVEDDLQLAAVAAVGCDLAQGYRFGRPRPAAQTLAWLDGRESLEVAALPPLAGTPVVDLVAEPSA